MPLINVDEVNLKLGSQARISGFGEIELYKSHAFERAIHKWMVASLSKREQELKVALEQVQRRVFSQFQFSKSLPNGASLHESLTEALSLSETHLQITFDVLFEGNDLSGFKDALRNIDIEALAFSEEDAFKRDLQLLISENYLNEVFLQLFHSQQTFSLREILLALLDDQSSLIHAAGKMAVNTFMTSAMWLAWLPSLREEFGSRVLPLDIRCGFSRSFMDGRLESKYVT